MVIGFCARIAPLLDPEGRGLRQFPTEDGYLMLTVARNLALDHGMSTAAGEIPTNGVQPLATFLYAAGFRAVSGDRVAGVLIAQWLQLAIACAAAALLYLTALQLLGSSSIALFGAALWFAAPNTVVNSLNCLETGAYVLVLIAFCLYTVRRLPPGERWPLRACAVAGAWLALAFWARNDALLLAGAFCAQRLIAGWRGADVDLRRALVETSTIGGTAAVLALPWVTYNWLAFGHLMPISGVAESANSRLGQNLPYLPAAFAEYIALPLKIPLVWETRAPTIAAALLLAAAWVAAAWMLRARANVEARQWLEVLLVWALALGGFYGLAFGAPHFTNRYVFALSPLLAVGSVGLCAAAAAAFPLGRTLSLGAAGLAALACAGLNVRTYLGGMDHPHFQVVEWVDVNVPDDVWVAAIQTGTLGFFHDRTLNLDGKVNPHALEARLAGRTQEYVLESPAQYLVDWTGIAAWAKGTALEGRFEVIELDTQRNLAVLRRIAAPIRP
jgi:predicted membrane protein